MALTPPHSQRCGSAQPLKCRCGNAWCPASCGSSPWSRTAILRSSVGGRAAHCATHRAQSLGSLRARRHGAKAITIRSMLANEDDELTATGTRRRVITSATLRRGCSTTARVWWSPRGCALAMPSGQMARPSQHRRISLRAAWTPSEQHCGSGSTGRWMRWPQRRPPESPALARAVHWGYIR